VPPQLLAPIVIGITTIAAFQATRSVEDLALVAAFGVLGFFMKAYRWPRPPILIAIVLSGQLEKWMTIAVQTRGWSMIWQPAFIGIMVLVVGAVIFSLRVQSGTEKLAERTEDEIAGINIALTDPPQGPTGGA
jgi:TctA family transporter